MDAVLLARIQFGFTVGFHFLFPPTTLALTMIILILETGYIRKKDEESRRLSAFLIKILALVFVLGTATGIVMEFAFGNNWAEYSKMVGDIFGAPLAAEAIFAFFLESVFLGILVFGRERVSKRMYWVSSLLVFLGAHLSGLWIIIANSWMQTPAGFRMEGGRAVLTDFWAAAFNPSTGVRFLHTILGSWIAGSLLVAAIAAWYLLKGKFREPARRLLAIAMTIFALTALVQLANGHSHSVQVARTQPEKMAAFEALWETREKAPLSLFGIPDPESGKTHFEIGVPGLLSFMIHGDWHTPVQGLNAFPVDEHPPVVVSFASYHVMIALGMLFILYGLWYLFLRFRGGAGSNRWFLRGVLLLTPLGYVALETGWIAAEVGRQPWVVYRVLRTADAVSKTVPAGQILATLIGFVLVYALLMVVFLRILGRIVAKGPGAMEAQGY